MQEEGRAEARVEIEQPKKESRKRKRGLKKPKQSKGMKEKES